MIDSPNLDASQSQRLQAAGSSPPLLGRKPRSTRRAQWAAYGSASLLAVLLSAAGCGEGLDEGAETVGSQSYGLAVDLGAGWFGTNLGGSEAEGGTSTLVGGVFTVTGGGGDFWGAQDDGHFVYQSVTGDFDFTARVTGYSGATGEAWPKAALIFKEATTGVEPTAQAAGIYQSLNYATEDYWYVRGASSITAYDSSELNTTGSGALLRLTRTGNTFRSYHWDTASAAWIQHGVDRVVALNTQGYLGLGSTSSTTGALLTVTFADVSLVGPAPDTTAPEISNVAVATAGTSATITWDTNEPASGTVNFGTTSSYGASASQSGNSTAHSVTLEGLTEDTDYHYTISSADASSNAAATLDAVFNSGAIPPTALPAGWSSLDLGDSVALGGSATHTAGVFTVTGGGPDLWGYQDDAHFVYRSVTGDFELIAQLDGYAGDTSYAYAKGALVFKEDTGSGVPDAQAVGVYQSLNYDGSDYWYERGEFGIGSYSAASLNSTGGSALLRLTRTGDTFRSFHWDGASSAWVQHGVDRVVSAAIDGFVGMAATSGTNGGLLSVQFSSVSVSGGTAEPDTVPPVLSNIAAVATDSSAVITWTTNELATSTVDYGIDPTYGSTSESLVLEPSHSVALSGLLPSTTYHFRVNSADGDSNVSTGGDLTFTTAAVPDPGLSISDIVVSDITEHTATVSWTTSAPATSAVAFDLNAWPKGVSDAVLKTSHSLVLTRMMAGDSHEFVITSDDGGGEVSTGTQSLTTVAYGADALPSGWTSSDIGPVSATLPGSAVFDPTANGGSFIVRGTGTDVFNDQDSFHFVRYPVTGDFVFTLRVEGYHGYLHEWTKAMTMFRVDLDDDSQFFNQSINNSGYDWLYYRDTKGALHTDIADSQINPGDGAAVWARLTRVGDTFTEEYSADGTNWQFHGPALGTTVSLPTAGYVGFGVTSKSNDYLSEIIYSNVSVVNSTTPDPDPDTTAPVISNVAVVASGTSATITWDTDESATSEVSYGGTASYGDTHNSSALAVSHSATLTGLTPNTTVHFSVTSADAAGNTASTGDSTFDSGDEVVSAWPTEWSNIDLGNSSALGGDATYDAGVFTVSGSGGDLWGSQDDAHFVYQAVNGDFELIVQVDSYAGDTSYAYAKAALMFKEDAGSGIPTATAEGVYQSLNYAGDDYWYERGQFSIDSYNSAVLNTTGGGARLRLTRTGDTFRSYTWDSNTSTWVQHGGDRVVTLNTAGFVGFAATSGLTTGVLSVNFSGVTLGGGEPAVPDTDSPVISNIVVTPEGTSAIVNWSTDEPATSVVDYGPNASYGAQASTPGLTTNHQVVLTGLTENTVYHFSVLSADGSDNQSTSANDSFDAGSAPLTDLPAGWLGVDLNPSSVGDSYYADNQFVVSGRGGEFWGNADGGHVVYQQVTGDFDLQATVVSFAGDVSATYCKGVLLFKEEVGASGLPTAGAAAVIQSVNYGAEDYWYQRDTNGGGISSYSSSWLNNVGASVRVRLTRSGDIFRSYRWDTDLISWVQIGADRTVALNTVGFVGMGATSTTSSLLDVTFGDVSLSATPAP